jgi:hypothetical protein
MIRWVWLVVLATWLIVAHGCHGGDHDDELAVAPGEERAWMPRPCAVVAHACSLQQASGPPLQDATGLSHCYRHKWQ